VPVGNVSYRGAAGIGNAGAGMGTAGAIGRRWLGMMQGPPAAPQPGPAPAGVTPDMDAQAFAQAFGAGTMAAPPPPVPAGIENAPPMAGQQFAAVVPPMHPHGQRRAPVAIPASRPMPPPVPPEQQQAQAAPPSRMGRAGGAALQYLAQQVGQRQGPLF
jgi:hypothetical protein